MGTAEALRRVRRLYPDFPGDSVVRRVWRFADELIGALQERGFALYSSNHEGERSGIFSFTVPGHPAEVAASLGRQGIEVAVRAGRLRISPHFYNNRSDLARLLAALDAIRRTR
jgi:selenocysteine lyase/cysteine desulfurase